LHDQTLLAYNSLHLLFDKVSLDIKTNCTDLKFWGVYNYKDVDKLPFRFLKSLLAVKKQTQNSAVYREFDRYSLSVICKLRSLKFWLKIMINISSPLYIMYRDQGNNINSYLMLLIEETANNVSSNVVHKCQTSLSTYLMILML